MSKSTEQFKEWFDAVWAGDMDIPVPIQGEDGYSLYMEGYELTHGAWVASEERSKWLPIEQAPKDVVSLLLAIPGGDVVTGSFNNIYSFWYSPNYGVIRPSHFQYLPKPPEDV